MEHLSPPSSPLESPEPPTIKCTPPPQFEAATPSPQFEVATPSPGIFISPQQTSDQIVSEQPSTTASADPLPSPEYLFGPFMLRTKIMLTRLHHASPTTWCCGIFIAIFAVLIILVALLFLYVGKPKYVVLDTNGASLDAINFDESGYFYADFSCIVNFSNINKKLDLRFKHAYMMLDFENIEIATQSIRPFNQRRKDSEVLTIHFISSSVYLPPNQLKELQKQLSSNKVLYSVRGKFRMRVSWGLISIPYTFHWQCELQMGSPPSGSLIARSC